MTDNDNTNLLKKIYQTTSIGLSAAEQVLPKVKNQNLRRQIGQQEENYRGISAKARRALIKGGNLPLPSVPLKKAMLWSSIQMTTLANKTPCHIAEIMINGTTMGIIQMTKDLHQITTAEADTKALAQEYIEDEQSTIEAYKAYLA